MTQACDLRSPGVRFSGYLSLCLAGLCLVFLAVGRWAESSRTGGIVRRVLLILLAAGLLLFAAGLLLALVYLIVL